MSKNKNIPPELDGQYLGENLDELEKRANNSFRVVGFLAFVITVVYFFKFSGLGLSGAQGDWGTFGDYIGGILNPTISIATLYWLTRSIILQKRELQESRDALRDAAYSQSKQAKASEAASKFQFITMEMEMISSELDSEYSYQMLVLSVLNDKNRYKKIFDRTGELRSAQEVLTEIGRNINILSTRRKSIMRVAKYISPEIDVEISAFKSL